MPKVNKLEAHVYTKIAGGHGKYEKTTLYMAWGADCLQYKKGVFWHKIRFEKVVSWEARIVGESIDPFDKSRDTRFLPCIALKTALSHHATEEREFVFPYLSFENWLYWIVRGLAKYSKAPMPEESLSVLSPKHQTKVINSRSLSSFDTTHEIFIGILETLRKENDTNKGRDFKLGPNLLGKKVPVPPPDGPQVDGVTKGGVMFGKVTRRLGQGGSGTSIYELPKLLQPVLQKDGKSGGDWKTEPMVVKVPIIDRDGVTKVVKNTDVLADLVKESRILAILGKHPNIVGLIDAHVHGQNRIYLFLQKGYCDLSDFRKKETELSPSEIRKYAVDILSGIDHMHRLRVYHCDMKPENVMIFEGDTAKLIDFGTAKTRVLHSKEGMFGETWAQFGTKGYISPESWDPKGIASEEDLAKRDAFAAGMTIFNALLSHFYAWEGFEESKSLIEPKDFILKRIDRYNNVVRDEKNRKRMTNDRLLILADAASGLIEANPKNRLTVGDALMFVRADMKQHRQEQMSRARGDLNTFNNLQFVKETLKKSTSPD